MFRSATLDNFYNDMQIVYDTEKKSYMDHFIIKDMMDAWMKQKHYPVLKIIIDYKFPFLTIKIENYDSLDLKYNWWIPITITKETEFNFTLPTIWHAYEIPWIKLSQLSSITPYVHEQFSVQEDEWYIINLQQIGKYKLVIL